jgi:hypothetical protein
MFDKISIANIIKDHISTLKNNKTRKTSYLDITLFFLIPLAISSFIVYVGMSLNDALVNALITSLSIFSALLFNLLLLVYDISEKKSGLPEATDPVENKRRIKTRELLREIYINISFSILVSIITVATLLIYFLKTSNCTLFSINTCSFQWLLALVIYYLTIQFALNLFMILKRIYVLLAKSF